MLGFWKASAWLRSRPNPDEDDDQRVLLLPKDRHNIPLTSLRPRPRDKLPITEASQQRYVHFGIGGAGNTCKASICDKQPIRLTPQGMHRLVQSKGGTREAE
jgi:hypothetical protein